MKARITSIEYVQHGLESTTGAGGTAAYTSDLAVQAASKLFSKSTIGLAEVDYLILCTLTPDFRLPTTACLVQSQIGLRPSVGAIDVAGGQPSFLHALALAQGLIVSGQARCVLVITADTDDATRAAAATVVVGDLESEGFDNFAFANTVDAATSVDSAMTASGLDWADPGLVVLGRANAEILDSGSSTLPIALGEAIDQGRVHKGQKVVLVGSDVQGAWAGAVMTW